MTSTTLEASRGRRLGAATIDFIVTGGVAFVAIWPTGIFEHHEAYRLVPFLVRLFALLAGAYVLVNGWFLYKSGQTVGKKLLGVRIVRSSDGKPLSFGALLIRAYSVLAAMTIPPVIPLVLIDFLFIFGAQRRCLHDYLVGSAVRMVGR